MSSTLLSPLWQDVLQDLERPSVFVQLALILACIAVSWGLTQLLRPRLSAQDRRQRLLQLGVESVAPVLWPLLALVLIELSRWVLGQWQAINVLRLASALIMSFALIRLAFYILRRIFVRAGRANPLQAVIERTFAILVWACFALHITGLLPEVLTLLEHTVLPIGKSKVSILMVLQAGVFVIITLVAALWLGASLEARLLRVDGIHASMRMMLVRLGKSVLVLLAVLFSLSLVGIDLTVLSVFGGALGVGIGLGLQKIVSNYVAGFIILLERSLSIGDVVAVDKYSGTVRQINVRYTTIRAADGSDALIPNEILLSNPVQNQYLTDRSVRMLARVTVGYESDVDMVMRLLMETTAGVVRVSKKPAPTVFLMNLGADGLDMEVSFWIDDPENGRANVLSEVNKAILLALQGQGISIPYPQREIRVVGKIGL